MPRNDKSEIEALAKTKLNVVKQQFDNWATKFKTERSNRQNKDLKAETAPESKKEPSNTIVQSQPDKIAYKCNQTNEKIGMEIKSHIEIFLEKDPVHESKQKSLEVPSSSKVKRDWNKLAREIDEEMKMGGRSGDDPVNFIFSQIYESSDENMKRTLIKSMQTSIGTILSTNWDEFKEKDYAGKDRPDAPGQEWKK